MACHAGLVLTDGKGSQVSSGSAAVLDINLLQETGLPQIRLISAEAFKLPKHMYNEEVWTKKNMMRRLDRALNFGDMIDFNMADVGLDGHVLSFTRIKPFIQSRCLGHSTQIILDGLVNPDDASHFYTDIFNLIPIPTELQGHAEPNIFVEAWIKLKMDENNRLDYLLHSFHGVCEGHRQLDIGLAPWNKNSDKYAIQIGYDESDEDEEAGERRPEEPRPSIELIRREAFMTGPRSFLLIGLPQFKCILGVKEQESNLIVGNPYIVDCIWNQFEKVYLVTSCLNPRAVGKPLPVDAASQEIRCSVRADEDLPAVFGNDQFGFIDDPHGVLSMLRLTKFKSNAIPVTLTDAGPNRCSQMRFRIEKAVGDKREKLEKIYEQEQIAVHRVSGVVIDGDHVFAAKHSPLIFTFAKEGQVPATGSRIIFDALFNNNEKKFYVSKWNADMDCPSLQTVERRMVKRTPGQRQTLFHIKVKTCGSRHLNKMFFSEQFGLLDDNLGLVTLNSSPATVYDIWVKKSEEESHEHAPRTVFHVIGCGRTAPADRVKAPQLTEAEVLLRREFYESIRQAVQGNATVESSRFSAPQPRPPPPPPAPTRIAEPELPQPVHTDRSRFAGPGMAEPEPPQPVHTGRSRFAGPGMVQKDQVRESNPSTPQESSRPLAAPVRESVREVKKEMPPQPPAATPAEPPRPKPTTSRFAGPGIRWDDQDAEGSRHSGFIQPPAATPAESPGPKPTMSRFAGPGMRRDDQDRAGSRQSDFSQRDTTSDRPTFRSNAESRSGQEPWGRATPRDEQVNQRFQRMRMDRSPTGSQGRAFDRTSASSSRASDHPDDYRETRSTPRRDIPMYAGAVRLPPGSGKQFDVVETLVRLKAHVCHHDLCGNGCFVECRNLDETAKLIVNERGFFAEARQFFPMIAQELFKKIQSPKRS